MFTGIIEATGLVKEVITNGSNRTFWIESSISPELSADQSVSHNGVCLTIEEVKNSTHRVTAIAETMQKTNLYKLQAGDYMNLERCLRLNDRVDGHIVQGHVDTTAVCIERKDLDGSYEFRFRFPAQFKELVIEKGSIGLNGISLTIFNVGENGFSVAVIPYTSQHTNIRFLKEKDEVNIEFDMMGKYVQRNIQFRH
jgi:riboflavin synthase